MLFYSYLIPAHIHMCIFTTDINKNNNAGEHGRSKAWSSSEVRLHQSRSNLKIIVKTKELDDNE